MSQIEPLFLEEKKNSNCILNWQNASISSLNFTFVTVSPLSFLSYK
jgi:hypothetical protein